MYETVISVLIWDCVIRDKIFFRVPERHYVVSAIWEQSCRKEMPIPMWFSQNKECRLCI